MASGCRRHDHGDVVVAVKACDFLDEVGRQSQVGTPRGGCHGEHAVFRSLNNAANGAQQLSDTLRAVRHTGQALNLTDGQRDDDGLAALIDIRHALIDRATAVLDKQLNGALRRDGGQRRIGAALEPLCGLGVQLVTTGATRDRHGVKVRGFEQDVCRVLADLGVGTTHDTCNTDNARALALRRVGDQQILRVEVTLFLIQGHQRFAGASTAHDDRGSKVTQVVGVHRLAKVQHDVVRDVDSQGQRAHARSFKALDHPARRRSVRVGATNDACNEAVHADASTDRGVIREDNREAIGVRSRRLARNHARQAGIAERGTRRVRVLAGNAAHREAVTTVRSHVNLQDLFTQPQPRHDIRADLGNLTVREILRQHDDARVVLAQAKLTSGANHAIRDVAVGLTRCDLEITGQNRAGKGDDDEVVDVEVMGAADNAAAGQLRRLLASTGGVIVLTDIHAAVVDDLAVGGGLLHAGQDATDDERSGHACGMNFFLFQANLHKGGSEGGGVRPFDNVDVIGQPAQRDHRHVSYPFHSLRTAGRSERLPQRCHACRQYRGAASACARCPCRTRSPNRPRDQYRSRAARSG